MPLKYYRNNRPVNYFTIYINVGGYIIYRYVLYLYTNARIYYKYLYLGYGYMNNILYLLYYIVVDIAMDARREFFKKTFAHR